MSRNVRRKPTTPVKATKSRRRRVSDTSTSSLDLSDDYGYSAVEDISDSSDDDEDDVAAAEEENILIEAHIRTPIAPRPQIMDDEDDEADDENDEDADDIEDDDDDEVAEADADAGSWAGIVSEAEEDQVSDVFEAGAFDSDITVERHVRFDVPWSDSSSTETDVEDHLDMFPDIFIPSTSLDPAFRREIEDDQDDDSSVSGSFWDFNNQYDDAPDSETEEVIRQFATDETLIATSMASQPTTAASTPVPTFEEPQELNDYDCESCLAGHAYLVLTHTQLRATLLKRMRKFPRSSAKRREVLLPPLVKLRTRMPTVQSRFNVDNRDWLPTKPGAPMASPLRYTTHRLER